MNTRHTIQSLARFTELSRLSSINAAIVFYAMGELGQSTRAQLCERLGMGNDCVKRLISRLEDTPPRALVESTGHVGKTYLLTPLGLSLIAELERDVEKENAA